MPWLLKFRLRSSGPRPLTEVECASGGFPTIDPTATPAWFDVLKFIGGL
jgi:hypothetical protein